MKDWFTHHVRDELERSLVSADRVKAFIRRFESFKEFKGVISSALLRTLDYEKNEIALLLLGAGANVHERSVNGWTPLHYAARNNNVAIVKSLVARGADVNAESKDAFKSTPMKCALIRKHKEIVEILLQSGASADNTKSYLGDFPEIKPVLEAHSLRRGAPKKPSEDDSQALGL